MLEELINILKKTTKLSNKVNVFMFLNLAKTTLKESNVMIKVCTLKILFYVA